MLRVLVAEPDLVIPVSLQPTFNTNLIMCATEGFLQRNGLNRPLAFEQIRLFNICGSEALFFKSYVLIYGLKGDKSLTEFNLVHKIKFTYDIMLQAGSLCP